MLRFAKLHDDLLSAKDPVLTLRLAAAFCMLAVLSNIFRCSRIVTFSKRYVTDKRIPVLPRVM